MYIPQTFRSGSKFNFSIFWEGKSLNFEKILARLPFVSILLIPLCDQDIICSTRVSYQVNPNNMCHLLLVICELNSVLLAFSLHCLHSDMLKNVWC